MRAKPQAPSRKRLKKDTIKKKDKNRKEKIMNEGMENLKQIAELEEKCMKDKAIIEYVIGWLDSNIDEPCCRNLATNSADLKERITNDN